MSAKGTIPVMTSRVLTPSLAAAVERARGRARASGELRMAPVGVTDSPFEAVERALIAAWRSSGEYDLIVADIVAEDPDLATQ
jgi:hypothetical protein